MRELRMARNAQCDDVTNCRNPWNARPVVGIDLNVALLRLDSDTLDVEPGCYRAAPGRHQKVFRVNLLHAAVGQLCFGVNTLHAGVRAREPGTSEGRDPLLTKRFLELGRDSFILDRYESRQQLDDGDVAPEATEDGRELHADSATPQDGYRLRHLAQVNRFIACDDAAAVDLDPGRTPRGRAGGDNNLLPGVECLEVTFEHLHATAAGQASRASDPVDPVLLEEKLDAFGQTADDAVFPRVDLAHIDSHARRSRPRAPDGDAPFLGVSNDFECMGVLEERLRRDAPPDETGASERLLLLDNSHGEAQLGSSDRGHVAAGAGTDHDDVVIIGHGVLREWRRLSWVLPSA